MKEDTEKEKKKKIDMHSAVLVAKRIALGSLIILFVGVCAYAFLILMMAVI